VLGQQNPGLFLIYNLIYLALAALAIVSISLRWPRFEWQVSFQIIVDIILIVLMMSVSGGVRSGLGLLLIVSLASSGLISRGRLVLLQAALATFAVLAAHTFGVLDYGESIGDYAQAGLLGVAFLPPPGLRIFWRAAATPVSSWRRRAHRIWKIWRRSTSW
jgi:hypothetical protein